MKTTLSILTFLLFSNWLFGQSRTLTGKVVDQHMESLSGVNICNLDTVILGATEIDGTFEIKLPTGTDELLFRWIAMVDRVETLKHNCDHINVLMMFDGNYCYRSERKNERKRRKDLAKQPELLEMANEQGVFEKNPCK